MARYSKTREVDREGQKPPTCEDKASDSCDKGEERDGVKEQGRRRELILELRLEVKERGRAGIQP